MAGCNHLPDAQSIVVCEVRSTVISFHLRPIWTWRTIILFFHKGQSSPPQTFDPTWIPGQTLEDPILTQLNFVHDWDLSLLCDDSVHCCETPSCYVSESIPSFFLIKLYFIGLKFSGGLTWTLFSDTSRTFNHVVRLLVKKNVVTDLARVVHHVDLTSRHVAMTINAALKCLELISRVVNIPAQPLQLKPRLKSESQQQDSDNNTHTGEEKFTLLNLHFYYHRI